MHMPALKVHVISGPTQNRLMNRRTEKNAVSCPVLSSPLHATIPTAWAGCKGLATASLLLLLLLLLNNVTDITDTSFDRDPVPQSSSFSPGLNHESCDAANCLIWCGPHKMAVNVVLLGCGLVGKAVLKMLVRPYCYRVPCVPSFLHS